MALPKDMQRVPVVLLKEYVNKIDYLVSIAPPGHRSRSAVCRGIIEEKLQDLSLPDGFQKETKEVQ